MAKTKVSDYPEPGQKVTAYTDYRGRKRMKVTLDCGEGLTEQSQAKQTDINYILREYTKTGFMRHSKEFEGRYDDVTGADFNDAMNLIADANTMFEELPSGIRNKFKNDPAQFLDYCQDPANTEALREWGVLRGNDGLDAAGAPTQAPTVDSPPPP